MPIGTHGSPCRPSGSRQATGVSPAEADRLRAAARARRIGADPAAQPGCAVPGPVVVQVVLGVSLLAGEAVALRRPGLRGHGLVAGPAVREVLLVADDARP